MTFYTVETNSQDIQLSLESIQSLILQADRIELLFNKAWIWTTGQQLFSVTIDTWNQIQEDTIKANTIRHWNRDKKISIILEK
jgi:hypothetical protein